MRYMLLLAVLTVPTGAAGAQQPDTASGHTARSQARVTTPHHIFVLPERIEWKPAPAAIPPGAEAAVIEGDPTRPGLFTMRLRFPDGYRIKPHYHAADEHATVISGTLIMGLGDTWDESKGTPLPAGAFSVMAAGTRHFAWARGETVIQVHAMGPWKLTYVNQADDPRNATK
jgi:quercetin dioxygenase-like cupin family protein